MAIIKKIELENGINVNYHRIVSINNIINVSTIIEVGSYISKEKRAEEQTKSKSGKEMDVFIKTTRETIPYDEKMNVEGAYKYIKTLKEFEGCQDE